MKKKNKFKNTDMSDKGFRIYLKENSCIFKKNNDKFGALSNMSTNFPLIVQGHQIKSSEALYQACKYPFYPDVQLKIFEQKSPMTAKMIGRANSKKMRPDWDTVKVNTMRWCLHVKLAQHFIKFGEELIQTDHKNIVENSSKDSFWGAIPNNEQTEFVGINALGRLLMELREEYYSKERNYLLIVRPPNISSFLILGKPVDVIDESGTFSFVINSEDKLKKAAINTTYNQNEVTNLNSEKHKLENETHIKGSLKSKEKKKKKSEKQIPLFHLS